MSNTILKKITWLNDEDLIEILETMREFSLQLESNEDYLDDDIFIENVNKFSKKNSRYKANGIHLQTQLLDKYGRVKINIDIRKQRPFITQAKVIYETNELDDSIPEMLFISAYRNDIIRKDEILFGLTGSYNSMYTKDNEYMGLLTSRGEKIKVSFLQKLKMLAS